MGGVEYAAYNVGTLPAVLFGMRHLETRKEAVVAGLLSGPIAIIPGCLFFIAMIGHYPDILPETVPSIYLLERIGSTTLLFAFQIMLLGTLVETGTALIHGVNERVATRFEERKKTLPTIARSLTAVGILMLAALIARVGLSDLIGVGYRTVTYGFWAVYLIPVLSVGVLLIVRRSRGGG